MKLSIEKLTILFYMTAGTGLFVGICINMWYGFIACLCLAIIMTYSRKNELNFGEIIGIGTTAFMLFTIILGVVLSVLMNTIEYDEIVREKIYKIKLLENETIVYERNEQLINVKDRALYYKCKVYNCSDFVIKVAEFKPKSKYIAENLSPVNKIQYDIK